MTRHTLAEAIAVDLTRLWYELVGLDHHKDRDCHWTIEQVWSYGQEPTWRMSHNGYVAGDIYATANSYGGALRALIETLIETIKDHSEYDQEYIAEWAGEGVGDSMDRIAKELEDKMPAYQAALAELPGRIEIDGP